MNFDLMNHALHALDDGIGRQPRNLRTYPSVPQADDPPPSPDGQHGRKTALSGAQHELSGEGSPAGPGTAGAGSSVIVRYWTVRYEARGRSYYDHVIACDPWKATMVVMKQRPYAACSQVVREIQRDEYEHLTRVSP